MPLISRRNLLAISAGAIHVAAAASQETREPRANRKLKVIVTGGHPGDPEYGCGGAIARYADLGHEVVLLYLNKGEWTDRLSDAPGSVRSVEAKKACAKPRLRASDGEFGRIAGLCSEPNN